MVEPETRPRVHAFGSQGHGGIIRMATAAERRAALEAIPDRQIRGQVETYVRWYFGRRAHDRA